MLRFDTYTETFCELSDTSSFVLYDGEYYDYDDFVSPDEFWEFFDEDGPLTFYAGDVDSSLSEWIDSSCCVGYLAGESNKLFKVVCCLCSPHDVLEIAEWSAKLFTGKLVLRVDDVDVVSLTDFVDNMWCRSRASIEVGELKVEVKN